MVCSHFVKALCRLAVPPVVALAMLVPAGTASAASLIQTGSYTKLTPTSGQGLATLSAPNGTTSIVYRGSWSIPSRLQSQGWQHIGDPGAGVDADHSRSYLFDAYQGSASATSKMFEVTTPAGGHYDFVHRLVSTLSPPEANNNSFAAISPDGRWMVSGEWGNMTRLLVFPTPLLNGAEPEGATSSDLPLAGIITLTGQGLPPVQNLQGCDFTTPQVLLCSSDGPTKQIWQITLATALSGPTFASDSATSITAIANLPTDSACKGTYEAEGIDYYNGQVHAEIVPPSPCSISTTVYVYKYS